MEILIAIIVAIVVIGGISVIMLMRTRKERSYDRPAERELREEENEAISRPRQNPRPRPVKYTTGEGNNMTGILIGTLRAFIGVAALIILIFIFTSTQDAVKALGNEADSLKVIQAYAKGAFQAVITIGGATALYIFSKLAR